MRRRWVCILAFLALTHCRTKASNTAPSSAPSPTPIAEPSRSSGSPAASTDSRASELVPPAFEVVLKTRGALDVIKNGQAVGTAASAAELVKILPRRSGSGRVLLIVDDGITYAEVTAAIDELRALGYDQIELGSRR